MNRIGAAVRGTLRRLGLEPEIARADTARAWPAVAGSTIGADAARTRAVRVEEGTLVVAVPTAAWAVEIRLRERELVAGLRRAVPGTDVRRIRCVPSEGGRDGHP